MGDTSDFESSNSAAAGIYRQNAFYIRMSSLYNLDPTHDAPPIVAVAMHAHEYVHFLHNASTTAGQSYLLANLILLRALAAGSDDQGYFQGSDGMSEENRAWLRYAGSVMRAQLGGTAAKHLSGCENISLWECTNPEINEDDGIWTASTVFTARDAVGEPRSERVAIGLSFITEGVAYEVDREMRKMAGMPEAQLDAQTKAFPYLAYRTLLRSWSGRDLTARDCIAVGVTALNHKLSGFWLAQICQALRDTTIPLDEVLKNARRDCLVDSASVLDEILKQRHDLSQGDVIHTAMGEYARLAQAGVQLRQGNWIPEFSFLTHKLDGEQLREWMGSMLDCLIIQEKPDAMLDISWIGPGHIAQTDASAHRLGALQSALHFSQLHLTADGSAVATAVLDRRPTPCPFSGGCAVELADEHPLECKCAPWKRFSLASPGDPVCWYAAGVKALRQPTTS
ncbi:hypothetical protein [Burkholderia gladioli]|uniref:hypothetical protein n=1 Tax=Burkholderia gladioli TaxID=28095 RepID=UPI00163FD9ED|nr:hypothetical protein [Burkholderia gladioli]